MKGIIILLVVFCVLGFSWATPLDDYVNAPDPSYKWVVNSTIKGLTYTAYNIRLTSQTWMTLNQSNYPTWEHWLVLCIPDVITSTTGFIYVDGGNINDPPPTSVYVPVELICVTGSVGAHLQTIPNEPIVFQNDGIRRTEDGLIAYTWSHFMNDTSDPIWLARMPMVKATVKAMDAIQDFTQKFVPRSPIQTFVIGGASKRGWTTWLAGAVDKRVIAIVPIVMPILNIVPNMGHQWQCYGEWSFALSDYLDFGLMAYLNTPKFLEMAAIIDPINYLDRLQMPKYILASSGDEFFLPDSPQFFLSQLLGPSYLRIVPNAEHSMAGHALDLTQGIATFFHNVVRGKPMPVISYNVTYTSTGAVITASSNVKPTKVELFHALTESHVRRDFRLIICGEVNGSCIQPILWIPDTLNDIYGNYTYTATVTTPSQGWRGFMIQFEYDMADVGLYTFKQSTQAYVVPNTLPFPPCGNNCQPGANIPKSSLFD